MFSYRFCCHDFAIGQSSSAELQCASECPPPFSAPFYTFGHFPRASRKERRELGGRSTVVRPSIPRARVDAPCPLTFSSFLCVRRMRRLPARAPSSDRSPQSCGLGGINASTSMLANYLLSRKFCYGMRSMNQNSMKFEVIV